MAGKMEIDWAGVFPAATTQFDEEFKVDLEATQRCVEELLQAGVQGIVVAGTVGEATSLARSEKERIVACAVEAAGGKAPVIAGVCEFDTATAAYFAGQAERLGANALMVMPPLMYVPTPRELSAHLRTIASATELPVMLYNNPIAYRTILEIAVIAELSDVPNITAIKESSTDTRRFTDFRNRFDDRFTLLTGADEVALEGLLLGASGWVSGMANLFPEEALAMFNAAKAGRIADALQIFRWFMPVLRLDGDSDLVQAIKLGQQVLGLGCERTRPPRLSLEGERRAAVIAAIEGAESTRASLAASH